MAFFDNSNWVRSTMGSQLGNLQGGMAPQGAMWEQYLNSINSLNGNMSQIQDPFTQMLLGQMPGYIDANNAYQGGIGQMLTGLAGNTQNNVNGIAGAQGGLAGSMAGYIDPFMQQFINGGQNNLTDYIQNELTGFGGNYANNQMGAQGNQLLANGGATPYTQNIKDISSYFMNQGECAIRAVCKFGVGRIDVKEQVTVTHRITGRNGVTGTVILLVVGKRQRVQCRGVGGFLKIHIHQ
jgi:hypothetical protein